MMEPRIKLTKVKHVGGFYPEYSIHIHTDLPEQEEYTGDDTGELIVKQILENQQNSNPIYREFYENWHHVLQENKQLKEKYLNETCGYCNEKMIVIGSRHVHACKHDLINKEKDEIIDENKNLKQKLEKIDKFLKNHSDSCLEMKLKGYPKILDSQESKK